MSDKNYCCDSHPSAAVVGSSCYVVHSMPCGTSKCFSKETTPDENNTRNNCAATHLHLLNARTQEHQSEKTQHHNFDQAHLDSTNTATTWQQKKLLFILMSTTDKIKMLFFLLWATLCRAPIGRQLMQYFHSYISKPKHKYQRTRLLSPTTLMALLISTIMLQQMNVIEAVKQSHFVHWNTSNPIFRIDNTDHIIDVNHGNKPWEYDQVNIICPFYPPGGAGRRSGRNNQQRGEIEQYIIYSVSKEEYDTCRITDPKPRTIAICNKPHELMYFTITFRSFTPTPGGMEFKPGHDYYFISTSSQNDLYRRVGGQCSTNHMKVEFKIADSEHENHQFSSKSSSSVNVPRRRRPLPLPYPRPGPSSSSNKQDNGDTVIYNTGNNYNYKEFPYYRGVNADLQDTRYETYDNNGRISSSFVNPYYHNDDNQKKRKEFDIHPNDVIKHEASRMAAPASAATRLHFLSTPFHKTHCDANKMMLLFSLSLHLMLVFFH